MLPRPSFVTALLCSSLAACSSDAPRQDGTGTDVSGGPIFEDPGGPDFGGGSEEPDPEGTAASCVGQTAGTEAVPAVLQLVVDTSGSMDQDAPGTRSTKWQVTRDALLDAVGQMPGNTSLGVVFYPDVPNTASSCFDNEADVAIAPLASTGSSQRRAIASAFARQSPDGGTPTHDAYRYAYGELARSVATGNRFAVVITDGTPTYSLGCVGTGLISDPVDSSPLVAEAERARQQGVSTFVIGSPGSEGARESLSRMAEAGGTAKPGCSHSGPDYCHFDMTRSGNFASDLQAALGTISGLALSCAYDIPAPPNGQQLDPARVNVLFTPREGSTERIARSDAAACQEGWRYSDDGASVQLCGATCDRVRGSQGTLSLEFGCATEVH